MATRIKTGALQGIDGLAVTVEADISRGLPGFHLVGLPNAEVRESKERVLAALRNSGFRISGGKVTVNLAPAGIRKQGASYDLAIAAAVIAASDPSYTRGDPGTRGRAVFLGELSLFGELRTVPGLLAIVIAAAGQGQTCVVVPAGQVREASLVEGIQVVGADSLGQVLRWWRTGREPTVDHSAPGDPDAIPKAQSHDPDLPILSDLRGQPLVRKAATVAAAGRHSLLMIGPPGTGKTRLARILGKLQGSMASTEALEVTRIHGAAGLLKGDRLPSRRPFRAPHHSITRAGLIGGGGNLRPGEVTLAHRGMLFLDEMAEFPPSVLDVLREPLEEGRITMARGTGHRAYPARFQLVGAMNPCRCGFLGSRIRSCRCTSQEVARHRNRLSGPLLDRIDLFVEVGAWQGAFLTSASRPHSGTGWRDDPRLGHLYEVRAKLEGMVDGRSVLPMTGNGQDFLEGSRQALGLSLRGVERGIKTATTIALLDGNSEVDSVHLREALEFRQGILLDSS